MLKTIFGTLSLILWFSAAYLWDHYLSHRPATPQPESGNTHSLENHGSVVYITLSDSFLLYGSMIAAGICFLLALLFWLEERFEKSRL
jgi:hypothetical protein